MNSITKTLILQLKKIANFIVLKNSSKDPFENAQPHPHFDYEKKVFTKDGREEYMEQLKALDEQHMKEQELKK